MSDSDAREMSLKEVANQYGEFHSAAKSYSLLLTISSELQDCRWWQLYRKYKLCKRFIKEMNWIENVR